MSVALLLRHPRAGRRRRPGRQGGRRAPGHPRGRDHVHPRGRRPHPRPALTRTVRRVRRHQRQRRHREQCAHREGHRKPSPPISAPNSGGVRPAVSNWLVFCAPSARPLQNGPAGSAIAVNARPLSLTVITEAAIITGMLSAESDQSATASASIEGPRRPAMIRMGRSRDPSSPTSVRPRPGPARRAPWATVTKAGRCRRPAAVGDEPHQGERPHHALRHHQQHRHRVNPPEHPGSRDKGWPGRRRAPRRAAGAAGRARRRRTPAPRHRTRPPGTAGRTRRRGSVPAGESPARRARLRAAERSAGCPSPARAARWEPADHQPPARRVAACRRHPAEQQEDAHHHQRVRCRRGQGAAAVVSAEPRVSTSRSPTRSTR